MRRWMFAISILPLLSLAALPAPPPAPTGAAAAGVGAVPTPSSVTAVGDAVYAASWAQGIIYGFPVLTGGILGPPSEYATGFSNPLGIVFDGDGWLYVADSHAAADPDRSTAGRVWAIPPGGGDASAVGEIVIDELPNGRHNTNGMAVHEGRLYITNGNSTDDGVSGGDPELPLSGTLLSVELGVRDLGPDDVVLELPEDHEGPLPPALLEAEGMRNVYDVAFRPGTDEAWMPTNGPDMLDPYGEDTLVAVRDALAHPVPDFGFPECNYADLDGTWDVAQNPAVETPCGEHVPPEQLLGLHVSADGLAFGPDDDVWGGDLYIAEFGNFFGDEVVGHSVVRVPIDAAGAAGEPQEILRLPAPLDLTFGAAGMYVADFAAGQILLVSAPPPPLP